jgi:putative chitinase
MGLEITGAALRALRPGLPKARAEAYGVALEAARPTAVLDQARRVQHFMAQVAHESGGFRALSESFAYRDAVRLDRLFSAVRGPAEARRLIARGPQAIANVVYAGRLGNGDAASGDGWRYRGRGFLMITGRGNYRELGALTGLELEDDPAQLGRPRPAAEAAARFWAARAINAAADADDLEAVTRLVNGPALAGLADRRAWLEKARAVWP